MFCTWMALRSKSRLKWPISYWYSLATQILLWFYRLFSNSNCTFLKTGWNDVFALEWLLRSKSYLKWPISFWYGLATQIFCDFTDLFQIVVPTWAGFASQPRWLMVRTGGCWSNGRCASLTNMLTNTPHCTMDAARRWPMLTWKPFSEWMLHIADQCWVRNFLFWSPWHK